MLNVLNLIPTLPYPPRTGAYLRAWNLCRRLSPRVRLTVLCRVLAPPPPEALKAFADAGIRLVTVLVPRSGTAARLRKGLPRLFGSHPVMAAGWDHAAMHQRLDELLGAERFDLVVVDGSPLYGYMPRIAASGVRSVAHLYDIESEFLARKALALPFGLRRALVARDARRMALHEGRMLAAADLVVVTSARERDLLARDGCRTPILVIPNGVDCNALQPLRPHPGAPELLFVGSLAYHPNADALHFFASACWPALRARFPDLTLNIVGRAPPAEILRLDGRDGIRVAGEVEDVQPAYRRACACVVPLRVGGGTRLKILEALALGRPVVSTSLGAEGLDVRHDEHLLLAATPADLVQQVSRLLENPSLGQELALRGRGQVVAHYDWNGIADRLYKAYGQLAASLPVTDACPSA